MQDIRAALLSAVLVIPQAIAFAALAGLPPSYGLWASVIPVAVAALLGRTPELLTGPVVALSLALYSGLSQYAAPGGDTYIQYALFITLATGALQIVLSILGAQRILSWVPDWGTAAILSAVGVNLIASQIPSISGLPAVAIEGTIGQAWSALMALSDWHWQSIATVTVTIAVAFGSAGAPWRTLRALSLLAALSVGSLFAAMLPGMDQTLGNVSLGVPLSNPLALGATGWAWWPQWIPVIFTLAVLGLLQTGIIVRRVGGGVAELRREGLSGGVANIVAACTAGLPISGSFNRSIAHEQAGARTRWAAVGSGAAVLCVAFVPRLMSLIAIPAMSGMLLAIGWKLIDRNVFSQHKMFAVSVTTAGVFLGLQWAVALALALGAWRHFARGQQGTESADPAMRDVAP